MSLQNVFGWQQFILVTQSHCCVTALKSYKYKLVKKKFFHGENMHFLFMKYICHPKVKKKTLNKKQSIILCQLYANVFLIQPIGCSNILYLY